MECDPARTRRDIRPSSGITGAARWRASSGRRVEAAPADRLLQHSWTLPGATAVGACGPRPCVRRYHTAGSRPARQPTDEHFDSRVGALHSFT
jgi:hypothetical protein